MVELVEGGKRRRGAVERWVDDDDRRRRRQETNFMLMLPYFPFPSSFSSLPLSEARHEKVGYCMRKFTVLSLCARRRKKGPGMMFGKPPSPVPAGK